MKPRPRPLDDWAHWLYDAGSNAASKDESAAPLRRLRCLGSPRRARHHDHMSPLSKLVAASYKAEVM